MIMDSGTFLSSLMSSSTSAAVAATDFSLGNGIGTSYSYLSFRFLPDGSADLKQSGIAVWFVTIHSRTEGDRMIKVPSNYFTVQIDPYNGHMYDYHP